MSNNFLVRQLFKASVTFFVGVTIAIGTLCPKVLAQSTRQLIVEWASEKTNGSQITLWLYTDSTYTVMVQTTTTEGSTDILRFQTVRGTYSITGNTIRFDLLDSSTKEAVTSAVGSGPLVSKGTYNEQGVYIVDSFSTINNGQTLLLNQIGGNVTATFPPLQLIVYYK